MIGFLYVEDLGQLNILRSFPCLSRKERDVNDVVVSCCLVGTWWGRSEAKMNFVEYSVYFGGLFINLYKKLDSNFVFPMK